MSSFNNIVKIKYSKNPEDVVALQEYILFENKRAKEKYAVFKFINNLNQRLLDFKFEAIQYNSNGELIEKSVALYEGCNAAPNEPFVPNAKLKLNSDCNALEIKLDYAAFERVSWSNGEFSDNSYRFETYAEKISGTRPAPVIAEKSAKKEDKIDRSVRKQQKRQIKKLRRYGFNMRNIMRKNRAVFPSVFNVFACILFIAAIVLSALYFNRENDLIYYEGYDLKVNGNYATICNYDGYETELVITGEIGEYKINRIGKDAFKNTKLHTLEFSSTTAITVESGAFENCKSLISVRGSSYSTVTVLEGAFKNCTALAEFYVPDARLGKKCFEGCTRVNSLTFYAPMYSGGTLLDLFGDRESILLIRLQIATTVNENFYKGVTLR